MCSTLELRKRRVVKRNDKKPIYCSNVYLPGSSALPFRRSNPMQPNRPENFRIASFPLQQRLRNLFYRCGGPTSTVNMWLKGLKQESPITHQFLIKVDLHDGLNGIAYMYQLEELNKRSDIGCIRVFRRFIILHPLGSSNKEGKQS
jgi:hypothetical protein